MSPGRPQLRHGRGAAGGPARCCQGGTVAPAAPASGSCRGRQRTGRGKLYGGTGPAEARGDPADPSGQRAGAVSSLTGKRRRAAASAARATSTGRPRGGAGGRAGACVNTGPRRPAPAMGGAGAGARQPRPGAPRRHRRGPPGAAEARGPAATHLRPAGSRRCGQEERPQGRLHLARRGTAARILAGPRRAAPRRLSPATAGADGRGAPGAGAPRNPAGEPPVPVSVGERRGSPPAPWVPAVNSQGCRGAPLPERRYVTGWGQRGGPGRRGLGSWSSGPAKVLPPSEKSSRCSRALTVQVSLCPTAPAVQVERGRSESFSPRITNSLCDRVGRDLNFRPVF